MLRTLFSLAIPWVLLAGCGDSEDQIIIADAGPPDAPGAPDAMVCTMTMCGSACVDTSSDPLHCGGCGNECASPARACEGELPCVCPDPFVPATISGVFDTVDDSILPAPLLLAAEIYSDGGLTHAFTVGYHPDETEVEVDVDLAEVEVPGVGVGYDVNVFNMTVRGTFLVTEGTLNLSEVCAEGIAGTVTGATFAEVDTAGAPIDGGCSFTVESVAFSIGECEDEPEEEPSP